MTWATLADRAITACRDLYGTSVTYTPVSTGVDESIAGILDESWESVDAGGEVPQNALLPVLDLRLADLSVAPAQGDSLVVDGVSYSVIDVQIDGQGGCKLPLHRGV